MTMKLTALLVALCLIVGVLSAALEPNIGPGLARDPDAVDSRIVRRGCWRTNRRDSDDSPEDPPSDIMDPLPGHPDAYTPEEIFGTTAEKCPKWDPPYGCGKKGVCWRTCGWFAGSWCYIALDNGIGPWQKCTKDEECKMGKVKKAECCQCGRGPRCGCGCGYYTRGGTVRCLTREYLFGGDIAKP